MFTENREVSRAQTVSSTRGLKVHNHTSYYLQKVVDESKDEFLSGRERKGTILTTGVLPSRHRVSREGLGLEPLAVPLREYLQIYLLVVFLVSSGRGGGERP